MKRTRMLFVEEISDADKDSCSSVEIVSAIPEITFHYEESSKDGGAVSPTPVETPGAGIPTSKKEFVERMKSAMKPANQVSPAVAHVPSASNERRFTAHHLFDLDGAPKPMTSFRTSHAPDRRASVMIDKSALPQKLFQKAKKNLLVDQYELKTIEDTLLYSILHPLFLCMKISGKIMPLFIDNQVF